MDGCPGSGGRRKPCASAGKPLNPPEVRTDRALVCSRLRPHVGEEDNAIVLPEDIAALHHRAGRSSALPRVRDRAALPLGMTFLPGSASRVGLKAAGHAGSDLANADSKPWLQLALHQHPSVRKVGDLSSTGARLGALFPALQEPPVRRYFAGQLVSTLGTWVQVITLNLLAWQLSRSPALLGLLNFLLFGPIAVLAAWAGSRLHAGNARRVTLLTVAGAATVSALLLVAHATRMLSVPLIVVTSALSGMLFAIELPARQVYLASCVRNPERIGNAISMNTLAINGARMVGPALAAWSFAMLGAAPGFLASAVASLFMLRCMLGSGMALPVGQPDSHVARSGAREAARFAMQHRIGSLFLPLLAVTAVLAGSYHTLVPVLADVVLGNANMWTGALLTSAGLGALSAASVLSSRLARSATRRLVVCTSWVLGAALLLVGVAESPYLLIALFAVVGFGLAFIGPSTNASLQQDAPSHLRGGLAGLYIMCHIGLLPIGYLLAGMLADRFGVQLTFRLLGSTLLILLVALFVPRWMAKGRLTFDGDLI